MRRYRWATPGDVNAFFGLVLDNSANLVITVSLLDTVYHFPTDFVLRTMIPGTALGVLVGDLLFTWMAFRLARRTGRSDVTAMPLGIDTPSLFGMVYFVLGPAFLDAQARGYVAQDAAYFAWRVGMCSLVFSGVLKLACATVADWVRAHVPRAGLLGSLSAIAVALIAFVPLVHLAASPVVGFTALAVILTTLVARARLPLGLPGALVALGLGLGLHYSLLALGVIAPEPHDLGFSPEIGLALPLPTLEWTSVAGETLRYLPVLVPFALATVIGGIDCTESAAAAGDHYSTRQVVAVEGLATLVAGFTGGVIQTTPYIGHPAYRAMGGRAAYTLATALFIGAAGMLGFFAPLYNWIPQAAILPILIFIGLEIAAQSFHATPARYYPALAVALLPALAYLVMIFADQLLVQTGATLDGLAPPLGLELQTLRTLSGGFILTSMLWAAALAATIDRRWLAAALFWSVAGAASLFGLIHSPLAGSPLVVPWNLPPELPAVAAGQTPLYLGAAYAAMAAVSLAWLLVPGSGQSSPGREG